MNKEIQHLYEELSLIEKEQLALEFEQAPKMLRYINALENFGFVSTTKAIRLIYDQENIEDTVLINRFYKLRKNLHLYLIHVLKNTLKSSTDEEIELNFLQLLIQKNEPAYALERAKKLEQKCWENNIFELLPELIDVIIHAIHFHKPYNIDEIAVYIEKQNTANDLLHLLNKFKTDVNTFRLKPINPDSYKDFAVHYTLVINKMRRKARSLKKYPRFSLIYHYVGFIVGSQMQTIVHKTGNVLTRHLNQLEKLLLQYPNMPVIKLVSNHRVHSMDALLLNQALYWYQKGNPKKSYQYILKNEQITQENDSVYLSRSSNDFQNIIICCWGAKEYEKLLKYTKELKEFQQSNSSIQKETPYFVYELLAYTDLFPKTKHPNPLQLIKQTDQFLKDSDENSTWIYETIGTFAMVYGYLKQSRSYFEHPPLIKLHQSIPNSIPTIELLNILESKDQDQLHQFILRVRKTKEKTKSRNLISHLDELEMLTKLFL